jgi:Tfp pilus assembly protein FimV
MSHTKGAWWIVDRGGENEVDIDAPNEIFGQVTVAMGIGPSNARRIVACVNACAGIRTDDLETAGRLATAEDSSLRRLAEHADTLRAALQTHAEEAAKLIEQRDELLAALQSYMKAGFGNSTDYVLQDQACKAARAAITNATNTTN